MRAKRRIDSTRSVRSLHLERLLWVRSRTSRARREGLAEHTKVISKKTNASLRFLSKLSVIIYGQPRRSQPRRSTASVNVSMNVPAVGRAPVQPASATRRGCAVRPFTMGDGRTRASIQDARGPRPGSGLGASVARPRAPRAAPHRRRESALSSNACRAARHLATLPRLKNCLFGNSRAKRRGSTRKKHGKKSNRVRF